MKGFLTGLFGGGRDVQRASQLGRAVPLEIEPFSRGLVSIPSLDFFGPHAASPNGRFHLIWQDRNPEGTIGGHRYEGHGSWTLLSGNGDRLATGRLERPQDGHVADTGTFILSDWMFGDGLSGRLLAFRADGHKLVEHEFSANLTSSGLSADGRFAICQTANAPGSADSCRYFLFDLDQGCEIANWEQETGWVEAYAFDPANRRVYLIGKEDERVGYDFDGTMIDREGWQRNRIAAGDIRTIRSITDAAAGELSQEQRTAIFAGLDVAEASAEVWRQAQALRLRGELHEHAGEIEAAIAAYDKTLLIDPQVGVSRKLAKLQRTAVPKNSARATVKAGKFE